jgi:hypothetical protein
MSRKIELPVGKNTYMFLYAPRIIKHKENEQFLYRYEVN